MKKALFSILAALAALHLSACTGGAGNAASTAGAESPSQETLKTTDIRSAANDPAVTLIYAETDPPGSIACETASHFKETVERLSGGSITIDLQASGVLGTELDLLAAMAGGSPTADIASVSTSALANYGCPTNRLLSLPYTFTSHRHWNTFAASDLASQFLGEPQQAGLPLRGLFFGEKGFRHFFTAIPVSGPAGLSGLKLRIPDDPVMTGLATALDAHPTAVPFHKLYAALQTGLVDGAEQPVANYSACEFPQVASYLILDGHTLDIVQAVICDSAWDRLTDTQRAVLYQAAVDTQSFNVGLSETTENEILVQLSQAGCTIIPVTDKRPWAEAAQGVIEENTHGYEALYQQLMDMQ